MADSSGPPQILEAEAVDELRVLYYFYEQYILAMLMDDELKGIAAGCLRGLDAEEKADLMQNGKDEAFKIMWNTRLYNDVGPFRVWARGIPPKDVAAFYAWLDRCLEGEGWDTALWRALYELRAGSGIKIPDICHAFSVILFGFNVEGEGK